MRTTPEAGGNALVPRSHRFPAAAFGRDPATHTYGKPVRSAVIEHIQAAAMADPDVIGSVILSHLEPGDLLLWKDITLHSGVPGWGTGPMGTELSRAAVFVLFSPRSAATPELLRQREEAVRNGWANWGNGHAAHHPVVHHSERWTMAGLTGAYEGAPTWGGYESLSEFQRQLI